MRRLGELLPEAKTVAAAMVLTCINTSIAIYGPTFDTVEAHSSGASQPVTSQPEVPCGIPSDESRQAVDNLLSKPGYQELRNRVSGRYASDSGDAAQQRLFSIAGQDKVSIVDLSPVMQNLSNYQGKGIGQPTLSKSLTTANGGLKPYGVTISLDPKLKVPVGKISTNDESANSDRYNATETIVNILDFYDDKPRDITSVTGINSFVLYKHDPKQVPAPGEGIAAGYVSGADGIHTAYLDVTNYQDTDVIAHESGHGADAREAERTGCLDIHNDPGFAELSGVDDMYTGRWDDYRYLTYRDNYSPMASTSSYKMSQSIRNNDKAAYCEMSTDLDELGPAVKAFSTYHPNVAEEKAEVYSQVLQADSLRNVTDPRIPVINSEGRLLLYRLFDAHPLLAQYLIDSADRPASTEPIVDC